MRHVDAGHPEPLGVALEAGGANVAVFSAHATKIELCLFDAAGQAEVERIALRSRSGDIHHAFVPGIHAGARYGLRAHGCYEPRHGHRFNPAKLLVDPYARALDRPFAYHGALQGGNEQDGSRDGTDSAPFVPKAILTPPSVDASARRPRVPWADTIVYELHVRGYTRLHSDVPEAQRGTCAGLAHPAAIAHLTRLGVTTVELMPIAAAIDERHLARLGLRNYWGYNPAAMFVPDPRIAPGGIDEVRACVEALHAAGIEVLLDVVLNHTGEGDVLGPTLSLRGLDNATYYRSVAGDAARYVDDTGCGNTLALDRPPVLRLAMDVLRYYATAAGVDGFRFDLATTLGRREDGFDPAAPLLVAIAQDPVLRDLKLVAEPWDLGPGGHRLGAFPAPWGEWNDRYRDAVRRFWRGDAGCAAEVATRLAGSADIFAPRSRALSRSVNFITAHDGFTALDLVSHASKHNAANGEDNRDGAEVNYSWNLGVEGETTDPAIRACRERDVRNLLATLLLSRGTPMLAMGDELGRTQLGNNNAYAQDNPLTWINWARADRRLTGFVAALLTLRKQHAAFRLDRPLTGKALDASGIADVEWRHADGHDMTPQEWNAPDGRILVAVLYARAADATGPDRVTIACNAAHEACDVRWPEPRKGFVWRRCVDTSLPAGVPEETADATVHLAPVAARSVVVLVEAPTATRRHGTARIEPKVLARLGAAAGIMPEWWDVTGRRHAVHAPTQRALLAAMGLEVGSTDDARARLGALADATARRRVPAVVMARPASVAEIALALPDTSRGRQSALRIRCEDGSEQVVTFVCDELPANDVTAVDGQPVVQRLLALPMLPAGYHAAWLDGEPECACRIVVAPERCFLPSDLAAGERRFGLAAHLYALRRRSDQGIGDFTTLAQLGAKTASAGGSVVGINPLHALFGEERERASPYHPSDRRFLDPIYIDVEDVPDLAAAAEARAILDRDRGAIAALAAAANVDYAAVWQVKRSVLQACFARFRQRDDTDPLVRNYDGFVAAGGPPLQQFAVFEAVAAAHPGKPWHRWPAELRRPDAAGIAAFALLHADRVRFSLYLQWLADRQFAAAAQHAHASGLAIGFLRDLAIGAAPDGAESWAGADAVARGVSVGAPPDFFSPSGQVWNLPPPIPHTLAAGGASGFRDLVAANTRHAGALRIDHVMGLERLFWVPDGARAAEGAYVRYPQELLLGVLALESQRARCLVVGEDLGTVPDGLRERLAATDVLSYRVLWFEREGADFVAPARYPAKAAACVSTHDLPTIAGWWTGADIDERHNLGLLSEDQARTARDERRIARQALADACVREGVASDGRLDANAPHDSAITAAIHRYACASQSALVLLQADDLSGEVAALNLPGTDRERPNWRRKVSVGVEGLWTSPPGAQASADFAAARSRR